MNYNWKSLDKTSSSRECENARNSGLKLPLGYIINLNRFGIHLQLPHFYYSKIVFIASRKETSKLAFVMCVCVFEICESLFLSWLRKHISCIGLPLEPTPRVLCVDIKSLIRAPFTGHHYNVFKASSVEKKCMFSFAGFCVSNCTNIYF